MDEGDNGFPLDYLLLVVPPVSPGAIETEVFT